MEFLAPRFIVSTPPYRGTWRAYRSRARDDLRKVARCCRCGKETEDAAADGWYYCLYTWSASRQLCQRCAALLVARATTARGRRGRAREAALPSHRAEDRTSGR